MDLGIPPGPTHHTRCPFDPGNHILAYIYECSLFHIRDSLACALNLDPAEFIPLISHYVLCQPQNETGTLHLLYLNQGTSACPIHPSARLLPPPPPPPSYWCVSQERIQSAERELWRKNEFLETMNRQENNKGRLLNKMQFPAITHFRGCLLVKYESTDFFF